MISGAIGLLDDHHHHIRVPLDRLVESHPCLDVFALAREGLFNQPGRISEPPMWFWRVPACRTSLLGRMVTGRLSSVDVENFPGHETRRVQVT